MLCEDVCTCTILEYYTQNKCQSNRRTCGKSFQQITRETWSTRGAFPQIYRVMFPQRNASQAPFKISIYVIYSKYVLEGSYWRRPSAQRESREHRIQTEIYVQTYPTYFAIAVPQHIIGFYVCFSTAFSGRALLCYKVFGFGHINANILDLMASMQIRLTNIRLRYLCLRICVFAKRK